MTLSVTNVWTNSTPSSSLVVTISPTSGRLLIAFVVSDSQFSTPSYSAGWTAGQSQACTADAQTTAWGYKLATGSETSVTITSGTDTFIGGVIEIDGVDGTTQFDVTVVSPANSNTASASPRVLTNSTTPVTNGAMLVGICGTDTTASVNATTTFSTTSGTTGAWTTQSDLNSGFRNIAVGIAVQTTAGAVTAQSSSTFASGNAGMSLFLIVIRPAASSGSTGTMAVTNAGDTMSASGTTTVTGTLAKTNANDSMSASGTTMVAGTMAATNAGDTMSASGAPGSAVTGTMATTGGNDTMTAAGSPTLVGSAAMAEGRDTMAGAGTSTILGTMARTNQNDTMSASGTSGTATASPPQLPVRGAGS